MIKLHKNGGIKVLDSASSLIELLKREGWIEENNLTGVDDAEPPRPRGPGRPKKEVSQLEANILEE